MTLSAPNWLHLKSNISSFLDTFHTNVPNEYNNSIEIELTTQNSSFLIGCWTLVLFSSQQRNVSNSEIEENLSFSFWDTYGIAELPCFCLSLL